jgi:hypothetical protein
MSRRPGLRGIVIALVCAVGLVIAGWSDADAAGRGGGRSGGGMSRSSPARSGGMSSRPAPQRSAQPSTRQAAPAARQQGSTAERQGTRQESKGAQQGSQGDREGNRDEAREDWQEHANDAREDRQDYAEDWDDHGGYYYHDNDWAEVMVVGATVGVVVAAVNDDYHESSTVTNVTNVTSVTALATLPCEARITVANGISFYQCGSNWYTRAYEGDAVVYVPSGPPPSN